VPGGTGCPGDTSTGNGSWTLLDYAMARHYHSQSGRSTTPDDPIFGDPSDPQSMNLYAYALPASLADGRTR
jgi:hypothetical protein